MSGYNIKNKYVRKMMETNEKIWIIAKNAAFRVGFIANTREIHLYASAIYAAMMWGWSDRMKEMEGG